MTPKQIELIKLKINQLREMNSILPMILDSGGIYDKRFNEIKERYRKEELELK